MRISVETGGLETDKGPVAPFANEVLVAVGGDLRRSPAVIISHGKDFLLV